MKIAVFSDIHGNYQALLSIIKDIKKNNIDEIIYLGDAVGLGPDPDLCLKLLYYSDVKFVLGNHELYCIRGHIIDNEMTKAKIKHHEWVLFKVNNSIIDDNCLRYDLFFNNKKFSFIHFFHEDNEYPFKHLSIFNNDYKSIFSEYDSDYVFYGHLHEGRVDIVNNKYFYGVGSSGCVKNKTFYHIIELGEDISVTRKVIKYDRKSFVNRINSVRYPEKKRIAATFFGIES